MLGLLYGIKPATVKKNTPEETGAIEYLLENDVSGNVVEIDFVDHTKETDVTQSSKEITNIKSNCGSEEIEQNNSNECSVIEYDDMADDEDNYEPNDEDDIDDDDCVSSDDSLNKTDDTKKWKTKSDTQMSPKKGATSPTSKTRQFRPEFKKLLCTKCDKTHCGQKALISHYTTKHKIKTVFKCVYCPQLFEKYRSFTRHVISHKETPRFACNLCDKSFQQKIGLTNHRYTHTELRTFNCPDCSLKFKHLSALYQHKKNVHSGEEFICEFCEEQFQSALLLLQHKKAKHLDQRDRICKICGKGYASTSGLRYHMTTHSKTSNQNECKKCKQTHPTLIALRRHIQQAHRSTTDAEEDDEDDKMCDVLKTNVDQDGTILYVCDICGSNFPDKVDFMKHFDEHKKQDVAVEKTKGNNCIKSSNEKGKKLQTPKRSSRSKP